MNNTSLNVQVHYYEDFFNSKHYSTTQSTVGWIHGFRTKDKEEPRIQWANCKLYVDLQLHRGLTPLTPMLFKGQFNLNKGFGTKTPKDIGRGRGIRKIRNDKVVISGNIQYWEALGIYWVNIGLNSNNHQNSKSRK